MLILDLPSSPGADVAEKLGEMVPFSLDGFTRVVTVNLVGT